MGFREWFYSVPLVNVDWGAREWGAILRSLVTLGWRNSGDVRRLEESVRRLTGAHRAVAFENGRSALRWILEAAQSLPGARGRRQVILPSLLCRAVQEGVRAAGLDPVLCDVGEDLTMDADSADRVFEVENTLAIIVPHIYGWPTPMEPFRRLARANKAVVIDDAAASLGGRQNGVALGMHGDAGLYSFAQGKAATAGGGGVLVLPGEGPFGKEFESRNPPLPASLRKAGAAFRRFIWYDLLHRFSGPLALSAGIARVKLGFKGKGGSKHGDILCRRMAGLPAAAARAQLERLEEMAEGRRRNMLHLREELEDTSELRILPVPAESAPTRFAVETKDLRVVREHAGIREENPLAIHLRKSGIEARYAYLPLHAYPDFAAEDPSRLPVSQRMGERLLLLPFFPPLGPGEMARIGRAVRSFFGR